MAALVAALLPPPVVTPTVATGFFFDRPLRFDESAASMPSPMRTLPIAILAAVVAACDTTSFVSPPIPSTTMDLAKPADPDGVRAWNEWHEERIRRLAAPEGWLSLVGLVWLSDGTWTVGRGDDPTSPRRIALDHAPAAACGSFEVAGDAVRFRPEPSVAATADGTRIAGEIVLASDEAGPPTVVRFGPIAVTLVRRNGQLALRIRDAESPIRTGFRGVERFPYRPELRVPASFVPAPPGRTLAVTNVTGFVEETPLAGELRFRLGERDCTLLATGLGAADGSAGLFVVFGDATNGSTTYGGGRFLEVPPPRDGTTILDFNRAVLPPCSFTPYATCPTPVAANRLPLPIEAGERAAASDTSEPAR